MGRRTANVAQPQKEAKIERCCYPAARNTGTGRAIEEFVWRDSCLQASAARFIPQGQVLPPDPGPRASADTTTAMDAGFTRATIEQELPTVRGRQQSLGQGEGATSSPRGKIIQSHNRDSPLHSVQCARRKPGSSSRPPDNARSSPRSCCRPSRQ